MSRAENIVDGARSVRPDDAFDVSTVDGWLKERVDGLSGTPDVRQFAGGASNLTYLLRYPDRELVLRRPPAGRKASSAHDMHREFRVQQRLRPVFPYVPEMLAFCDDPAVLGSDFYVMHRIPGVILRANPPPGVELSPERARTLAYSVIDRLVELHQVDVEAAGLTDLGKGAGYVRRQVDGWSQRYRAARTWNVPRFRRVMDWLAANQPPDSGIRVIHNDFRFDNVVLDADDPQRVCGVLDWEMATLGDPLMDLGNSLAYWVQADDDRIARGNRRQPTHLPGMPTRREVVDHYREKTGALPDDMDFYEVYGLFRLAVIAQQIYFRYHHKQTRNPAFRRLWIMVGYLDWRCRRIIGRSRS